MARTFRAKQGHWGSREVITKAELKKLRKKQRQNKKGKK